MPPEEGESPEQCTAKINNFLQKWMELANAKDTFQDLRQLIVKEQFINSVSPALEIHLKEKSPANLEELAKAAEQYLIDHGTELFKEAKGKKKNNGRSQQKPGNDAGDKLPNNKQVHEVKYFKRNKFGHIAAKCQTEKSKV